MSSSLSTLQIAALQEMGITVWSEQPVSTENNNASKQSDLNTSQTTSKTNLKHLRSLVSSDSETQRAEKPFPADAVNRFAQWILDVEHAMSEHAKVESAIDWMLGDAVRVTATSVCLPALPTELTSSLKKQLWQQIQQLRCDR